MAKHNWKPGTRVQLCFADGTRLPGAIVKNIDASCAPLTDMWLVEPDGYRQFGFSGAHIVEDLAYEPR